MTAGGSQDWRGGRAPRNSGRQEEAQPSWKQSRNAPAARKRKFGSKLQILLVVIFLAVLVGTMIWIFRPERQLRTHFVVMNLLEGSSDFDSATAVTINDALSEESGTRFFSRSVEQSLSLSELSEPKLTSDLLRAQTVVISLQSMIVPDGDGGFQCLVKNSTPDLDDENERVPLRKLRDTLTLLQKANGSKHVLLIVDTPPANAEWRTGYLPTDLRSELESWTTEMTGLVILLSCSGDQTSEFSFAGSNGQSAFTHFVSCGLSSLAESADSAGRKDQDLTVAEYCSYVAEHTDRWVKEHRNVAGQTVHVIPPIEKLRELSDGSGAFVVMRDVPNLGAADEIISPAAPTDTQSELATLWSRREQLSSRAGSRWNPLLWTAATDSLHRAETAWLRGQTENVTRAVKVAGESLAKLELITNTVCPDAASLQAERGLVRSDFESLPSFSRIADFWEIESEPVEAAIAQPAFVEDVIAAQLRDFPFAAVGLTPPTDADLKSVRSRRVLAEKTTAALMACAWRIPATVRRMEAELLQSEDKRFTRAEPDSVTVVGDLNPDALTTVVSDFAAAHDAAETALSRVLETAPSLAFWSANSGLELSVAERDAWHRLLIQNSVDRKINRSTATELLDVLSGIASKDVPGFRGKALQLREESFRLLVFARGLQQSLMFSDAEPAVGFTAEQLQSKTQDLEAWQTDVLRSVSKVSQLIEETIKVAMDESPTQLSVSRLLRSSLCLSSMRAVTRKALVENVLARDAKLQESAAASSSDSSDSSVIEAARSPVDEALWTLQVLNLMPCSRDQSQHLSDAGTAVGAMMSAGSPEERQKEIAKYGAAVRGVWKMNQENVRQAVQSTSAESHELLRLADQQARLFSGFDARNPAVRSPTERLRLMNRLQYCLMQIDRLLTGQWVEITDKPLWAENGWYANASTNWLKHAEECVEQLTVGAAGPPALAVQAISDLRDRLQTSEQVSVTVSPELHSLNLGEQNEDRRNVPARIVRTIPSDFSGEASMLVLPVTVEAASRLTIENNAMPLSLAGISETATLNVFRTESPGEKGCQPESFRTEVFFRGRRWPSDVTLSVNPCAPAEFIVEKLARAETANVTVSGSDPRPIAFILDWSGSMTKNLSGRQTSRAAEAIEMLRELIDNDTLKEPRVSLTVYGHRVNYDGVTRKSDPNPEYQIQFGKAIPRDLVESRQGAVLDIETGVFRGKADAAGRVRFKEILTQLENSKPWGITPLAGAIERTLESEDLKDKAGIVIAVTDGGASDVGTADDPEIKARNDKTLADLKEALGRSKSTVVIVAFDFKKNPVEREMLETIFVKDCGIKVVDAADKGELLNRIYPSLKPRSYSVRRTTETQGREMQLGETVSGLVPADNYEIRFAQIESKAPVAIDRGDSLKLIIDHKLQQLKFERPRNPEMMQRATTTDPADTALPDQPMILRSAPAHRSDIVGAANPEMQKAELSLTLDHDPEDFPVRQPKEIEFFIKPAGLNYRPPIIHQQYNADQGAPGWLITIDEWPRQHDFLVDAVWKMQRSTPDLILRWEEWKSADKPTEAKRLGGKGLPECTVWTTMRDNGVLQVRLDPAEGTTDPVNKTEDVRIEIGNRDTLEQNSSFLPREINTRIRKTEFGAVIFEFSGNLSADVLAGLEIAFTSSVARRSGSIEVRELQIDKRR